MNDTGPLAVCMGLTAAILYIGSAYLKGTITPCLAAIVLLITPITFFMAFESISVVSLFLYLLGKMLLFTIILTPVFTMVVTLLSGIATVFYIYVDDDEKGEHIVHCI